MKRLFCLLFIPLLAAGCGPSTGSVSGRVTFNGKPVPGGRVTFRPADARQNSVSAELDADGGYRATLPVGDVVVSIDNRELEPPPLGGGGLPPGLPPGVGQAIGAGKGAAKAAEKSPAKGGEEVARPSGRYVRIPEKYYDGTTSGLGFKVTGGEQKQDLELKP